MEQEVKNEPRDAKTRPLHAPEVPPLRRITAEDVRKVERLLRQRRAL